MRRRLRHIGFVLLGVACCLLIAAGLLLGTNTGSRWLIDRLLATLPVPATVSSVEGRLADRLVLHELALSWTGGAIEIESLAMKWSPWALPLRSLAIDRLEIDNPTLRLEPDDDRIEDAEPLRFAWPLAPAWLDSWQAEITHFQLQDFRLRRPSTAELRAERIAATVRLQGRQLTIAGLTAAGLNSRLSGRAEVGLQRPKLLTKLAVARDGESEPATLTLALDLDDDPGDALLAGTLQLTVSGAGWRDGSLTGDLQVKERSLRAEISRGSWLGGDLGGSIETAWDERPEVRLQLEARHLDPSHLDAEWTGSINLTAQALIAGSGADAHVRFDAAFVDSVLRGVPLHGTARGTLQGGLLDFDQLTLQGDGFNIHGQGSPAERLSLRFDIGDLGSLLPEAAGRLQGSGWFSLGDQNWLADFAATADGIRYRDFSLDNVRLAMRHQDTRAPFLATLEAGEGGYGSLHLDGVRLKLHGEMARHTLELETDLSDGHASARLFGRREEAGWQGTLDALRIEQPRAGTWSLVAPAIVQVGREGVVLDPVLMRSDHSELSLSGAVGQNGRPQRLELTASKFPLQIFNGLLDPWSLGGVLDARLRCTGQECALQASGIENLRHGERSLSFDAVDFQGEWTADGLQAGLELDLAEAGRMTTGLSSSGAWNWQLPEDGLLNVALDGFAPETVLVMLGDPPLRGPLSGVLSAAWDRSGPKRIALDLSGSVDWLQAVPAPVPVALVLHGDWHGDGLVVDGRIDGVNGETLVVQAEGRQPPRWGLPVMVDWQATFANLPLLGYRNPPPGVSVAGTWSGRAEGTMSDRFVFNSRGRAEINGGRLSWHDEDADDILTLLEEAVIDWQWQDRQLRGELRLDLGESRHLDARWQLPIPARLPIVPDRTGPLLGTLVAELEERGLLGLLLPELIQETRGTIGLEAVLGGTWQAPNLEGALRLAGGGAYLPAAGVRLEDVTLAARLADNRIDISELAATSGPGRLTGSGSLSLRSWQPTEVDVSLRGEDFSLIHLPELQLRISPDLRLSGPLEAPSLKGTILIPYLLVEGRSERSPVQVSPDVVVVDKVETPDEGPALKLSTHVQLVLGDQVLVRMSGFDGRLGGELELTGIAQQRLYGRGAIHVAEGNYSAYGTKLKIEKGRAVFGGGALDNPAIDILALKTAGEVKAGVRILGTARKPEAKLYSEPTMPDTDILSYIVFGRPLSQADGQSGPLMLAAGALLSAGDSAVLQSRLGLDTLEAGSTTGQTADSALKLGKYLTPDIYLSYGYSLFNKQSEVGLRYRIFGGWEAESTFGQESGADLYYRFEFD